jgi:alanine-synthesizing transaminase
MIYKISRTDKLSNVLYNPRGRILASDDALESHGRTILRLNISNVASYGFHTPLDVMTAVVRSLQLPHGFSDTKDLFAAKDGGDAEGAS